jgi:hypothetical protein
VPHGGLLGSFCSATVATGRLAGIVGSLVRLQTHETRIT